eukprot:s1208_g13.t1
MSGVSKPILEAFARFDTDQSGSISRDELAEVLLALDGTWTDESIDQLLCEADSSMDGELQVDEFIRWVFAEDSATLGGAVNAVKDAVKDVVLLVAGCSRWEEFDGEYVQMKGMVYGRRPVFYCAELKKYLYYHGKRGQWQIHHKIGNYASCRLKTKRAVHVVGYDTSEVWGVWDSSKKSFLKEPDMGVCIFPPPTPEELLEAAPLLAYQSECPVEGGEALGLWRKTEDLLNGRPVYRKMRRQRDGSLKESVPPQSVHRDKDQQGERESDYTEEESEEEEERAPASPEGLTLPVAGLIRAMEWEEEEVDLTGGDRPASPGAIREHLRRAPKPNQPTIFHAHEADFWKSRYVPVGSVIEFKNPDPLTPADTLAAVLVTNTESLDNGMWMSVRAIGGSTEEEKKRVQAYFKNQKRRLNFCFYDDGRCREGEEALHLTEMKWYPPGDFDAPWLTTYGRKLVAEGKKMEVEASKSLAERGDRRERSPRRGKGESEIEKRLSALRKRSGHHVTFADEPKISSGKRREDSPPHSGGGHHGRRRSSDSRAVVPVKVKKEDEIVEVSDSSHHATKKRKKSNLGDTLIKAAKVRCAVNQRQGKKRRSRSGSRSRKRKRHKRRHSFGFGGGQSVKQGELFERCQFNGAAEEAIPEIAGVSLQASGGSGSRDCKELAMLSRSLDLLREGRLSELADVLSARLIAVDTAAHQGWATARHLEVFADEEDGSAPAHLLLAAQKHARQVEKAGGKGSWPRAQQWSSADWNYDNRPKGKGKETKGKGKKGKNKGKMGKGWGAWNADNRDKMEDKGKKPEAAT